MNRRDRWHLIHPREDDVIAVLLFACMLGLAVVMFWPRVGREFWWPW